eukprot:tig00001339_g8261.t1
MSRFSPYVDNGGTVVAVAGPDYAVVAADTRLSVGFSVLTRESSKLARLTDKCVLASAGMRADRETLHKILKIRFQKYEQQHGKQMSTPAFAQMLANTLYGRRFFPYYTFNIVAGLDEEGVGAVYGYDAIGSFERLKYGCSGSGNALIQPILDNQLVRMNQVPGGRRDLSLDEAVALIKDVMTSAGERDIYTGDSVEILKITRTGVEEERFALKLD